MPKSKSPNKYDRVIIDIFKRHYRKGLESFEFSRAELESVARKHGIKNLGDIVYSFRFRNKMPAIVSKTATEGKHWAIKLAGRGKYRFKLGNLVRIVPSKALLKIKIPDSTPEIIAKYAQSDEQALLAKVRYNRLVDIFLGVTAYSLQNHWRTTVLDIGQIEVDEIYVGVNKLGQQFIIPVQAKGGSDEIGSVQMEQDIACCKEKLPHLICRPVAVQFLSDGSIAAFELTVDRNDEIKIVEEKHYELVPHREISEQDLKLYGQHGAAS